MKYQGCFFFYKYSNTYTLSKDIYVLADFIYIYVSLENMLFTIENYI